MRRRPAGSPDPQACVRDCRVWPRGVHTLLYLVSLSRIAKEVFHSGVRLRRELQCTAVL
jgi:hypothetical protein